MPVFRSRAGSLLGVLPLVLGTCAPFDPASDVPTAGNLFGDPIRTTIDTVASATRAPSHDPLMPYSETDRFDRALNSAMRGMTPAITVTFEPAYIHRADLETDYPPGDASTRIHHWLWRIRDTGGQVIACQEPPPEQRRMLGMLVSLVLGFVADALHDYVLYRPAAEYHARAVFDRDTARLKRIEFVRRDEINGLLCSTPLPRA